MSTDLYARHHDLTPAGAFAAESLVAQHFNRYSELTREQYALILDEAVAVTS